MDKKKEETTMSGEENSSAAEKVEDDKNDRQLSLPPSSESKASQRQRTNRKASLLDHPPGEYTFVVGMGMLMAFIAGYSNAVCLSGNIHAPNTLQVNQSVAGVTGVYTSSAISLAQSDWEAYKLHVCTILSVCGGACLSSLFNPYPIAFALCPRYGIAFLIGGGFTTLGGLSYLHNDQREFYFTAIGNGIMNGISSMYTSNLIRTTHLTGTTTDIGLFVGQYLCGNHVNLWKLYILAGLASSFWVGSLAGYFLSLRGKEQSLVMNAAFFYVFGVSIIVYNYWSHPEMTWCDALFGVGFCSSSDFHDSAEFREYQHGCIEPRGIFRRCCGNGVWCCKPFLEAEDDDHEKVGIDHHGNLVPVGNKSTKKQEVDESNTLAAAMAPKTDHAGDIEEEGCLLSENIAAVIEHDDHLVSKEELMEIFRKLDDRENGDGYVDTQELAMELLELQYIHKQQKQQARHSSRRSHGSVSSCALKSIDALRINSIREIESTGHHHVGR